MWTALCHSVEKSDLGTVECLLQCFFYGSHRNERDAVKLESATVREIAALARIDLTEDEIETFAHQLGEVLEYAEKLQQVNTDCVPPTPFVLPLSNVIRPDEAVPGLSTDEALANAPDRQGSFFRVRAFFDS